MALYGNTIGDALVEWAWAACIVGIVFVLAWVYLQSEGCTMDERARAEIGQDAVIEPFTCISGAVTIGDNCRVGPFAYLYEGADVPAGCVVGVFEKLSKGR